MLLAFVPMYFIAVAYKELQRGRAGLWYDVSPGPPWAFGPGRRLDGVAGESCAADVIVMASLAQIAGSYSYQLADQLGIHNDLANNAVWSMIAGLVWIAIMTYICYRGIEISARLQYALLSIEVLTLFIFAAVALVKVYSGNGTAGSVHPQLSWLWPGGLSISHVIAPAVLIAVFIYWGWDTAVATNEEADDPGRTPGRAAVISTVLLLLTYVLVSTAAVAYAGVGEHGIGLGNTGNAADVFNAIGPTLYGTGPLGKIGLDLLAISILTSASASTQTTILPTARTTLSMAVYRALPSKFARIHRTYLTPTWSTIGMGLVSAAFYLLMTAISQNILLALIGAIGLQIAFYYGLTGIACAWFYRRSLLSSTRHFVMRGVIPMLGGIFLFVMFGYAAKIYAQADNLTDDAGNNITIFGIGAVAVVGIGALLLGFVLLAAQWAVSPSYFRGETLPRRSHGDLLMYGDLPLGAETIALPDSRQATAVIAPDLSNLPAGQKAIDPLTGGDVRENRPTRSPLPTLRHAASKGIMGRWRSPRVTTTVHRAQPS